MSRFLGKLRYLHMLIYEARLIIVTVSAVSLSQHCVSSGNVMCSKPTLTGRFDLRLLWETSISTELSIKQGQLKSEFCECGQFALGDTRAVGVEAVSRSTLTGRCGVLGFFFYVGFLKPQYLHKVIYI